MVGRLLKLRARKPRNTEDEFIRASREFQSIIQQGIGRAKAKAGVSQQPMQGGVGGFKIERLD